METKNDEEGLTPAEFASPSTHAPVKKSKKKKGATSLLYFKANKVGGVHLTF